MGARKTYAYYTLLTLIILQICWQSCRNGQNSQGSKQQTRITVAAAANIQFAIKEIEKAFESAEPTIQLNIVIGSSGKLTAQIEQGAPYDLLVSANMKYPESLYSKGMAVTPPKVYAYGTLVFWTLYDLDLSTGLSVLTEDQIKKIAIANPRNAPYGEEAIKAFQFFNLYDQIKQKLVFGESIAQTNQYILSKSCNGGITSKSVVLSPQLQQTGKWFAIPEEAYNPIWQGITITKYGSENHSQSAQKFYDYLFGEEAREILKKYGYEIPD